MSFSTNQLYAAEITIKNTIYVPVKSDEFDSCKGCQISIKQCENFKSSCVGIIWIKKEV